MPKKPTPEKQSSGKPPLWADLLLTLWVLVVGVVYLGGYFVPAIGALTPNASAFYALMVFVSVLTLALRYLRRSGAEAEEDERTKHRK